MPSVFLELLLEAYLYTPIPYTPIDPEDPANLKVANLAFVTQMTTTVCKKIQKMDRFSGKNWSKLLEISQKVFFKRDNKEDLLIKINKLDHCSSTIHSWHSQHQTSYLQVKEKALTSGPMCLLQGIETGNMNAPSGNKGVPQPIPILSLEEEEGRGSFKLGLWGPMVTFSIEGQPVNFLIDTGALFRITEIPETP